MRNSTEMRFDGAQIMGRSVSKEKCIEADSLHLKVESSYEIGLYFLPKERTKELSVTYLKDSPKLLGKLMSELGEMYRLGFISDWHSFE